MMNYQLINDEEMTNPQFFNLGIENCELIHHSGLVIGN